MTLSLPVALGLLALFMGIGATLVFFALRETGRVVDPTPTATVTLTVTPTTSPTPPTPTVTHTPQPTPTPVTYIVQPNDTCGGIAFSFGVSVQSIVLLNNLPADCLTLVQGQALLIPQPTPTPTPLPTSTLSSSEATEQACEKAEYVVQSSDTLFTIAQAYNVPMSVIKEYNGLSSDTVFEGDSLTIPLCKQNPTPGPSPTPTPPPPYPAPNLLLPADGATLTDPTVTLQWASVGTLLENEAYAVTVVDLTLGEDRKIVEYVTDTKYIVPTSFSTTDGIAHIYRWSVMAVRQTGTDDDGNAIWEAAGTVSLARVFSWVGGPSSAATPTP
ncbi:MAG TPA: LysM peptidoglycan-binding domain-containing protein [Anaerolineales bacterium]|nr:LysM peptidoglycan-binding domain-containing protein [Anaerolineales bacterium]